MDGRLLLKGVRNNLLSVVLVMSLVPYRDIFSLIWYLNSIFVEHCDVNRENNFHQTPLIIAVIMDDFQMVKALVKAGN